MIDQNTDAHVKVGGKIERIAIITVGLHPCAVRLAERLSPSGADVRIFDHADFPVREYSWQYFQRLYKRRGVWTALDNFLLYATDRASWLARGIWRRVRRAPRAPRNAGTSPVSVPVVKVQRINRSPDNDKLREFAPDLILLAGAPILSASTAEIASVACINTHCGITPMYAGSSPETWAVYERNFNDIGFTIHLVNRSVDGGPVLYQERIEWDRSTRVDLLWPVLAKVMYDKLADIALDLMAGKEMLATAQHRVRAMPPAGFFVRRKAERNRREIAQSKRAAG